MQTIEINTAQNVVIEYELASLRDRFLSLFIDGAIVIMSYLLLVFLLATVFGDFFDETGFFFFLLIGLLPTILFISYQLISEVLTDGQSIGKKALGIKVVRVDGEQPHLSDYLLRAFFHFADTLLSFGVVGALLISSTGSRQRLGDLTANTTVIRLRYNNQVSLSDILRINTLENYQPQYLGVRRFTEEDMLLIKRILARYSRFRNEAHEAVVQELVEKVARQLELPEAPRDKVGFLKTLIRDYIVLTR